ncbi:hypothetical protein MKEN_01231200 [Mycena kentingensis (nom. inval.)]|nr:hypothetical protein MKEN_01231200 [Mycena kentingensis (nom. inval.)]
MPPPRALLLAGLAVVVLLAHLALATKPAAAPPPPPHIQGSWRAVRRAIGLPPPPAPTRVPLALPVSSRFDLQRRRLLETNMELEEKPPALYFAADVDAHKQEKNKKISS